MKRWMRQISGNGRYWRRHGVPVSICFRGTWRAACAGDWRVCARRRRLRHYVPLSLRGQPTAECQLMVSAWRRLVKAMVKPCVSESFPPVLPVPTCSIEFARRGFWNTRVICGCGRPWRIIAHLLCGTGTVEFTSDS